LLGQSGRRATDLTPPPPRPCLPPAPAPWQEMVSTFEIVGSLRRSCPILERYRAGQATDLAPGPPASAAAEAAEASAAAELGLAVAPVSTGLGAGGLRRGGGGGHHGPQPLSAHARLGAHGHHSSAFATGGVLTRSLAAGLHA
jgi:hypothetical protein